MSRAQVTIFIIISLVMITMFGVVYYMIGSRQTGQAGQQIENVQVSSAKIDPIREYVKSCLTITSAQGFELLGKQGGYIYKSQGGIVDDPAPADYEDYQLTKVYYGIYAPRGSVGTVFFSTTPEYPFITFPFFYNSTGALIFSNYTRGFYGRNKVPHLLKPQPNSMQEQLEKFTLNGTLGCIDWEGFERQGLNITALASPNITVDFAESDVAFKMLWPIKIEDKTTGAVTQMDEFIVIYPVRFKKIHEFAKVLIDADVWDITYDIRASDGEITSYVMPNVKGSTDLVKIIDSRSNILGEDYEYRFMRQNRPPAIYYINSTQKRFTPLCNESIIALTGPYNISFVDSCGRGNFKLSFEALDPDEEPLNFTYSFKFFGIPSATEKLVAGSPHKISYGEADHGFFTLNVSVTDKYATDWQQVNISTVAMG